MYSYLASSQLLYFCMIVMNPGATRTTAPFQQVLPTPSIIHRIAGRRSINPALVFVLAHFHLQPDCIKRARLHSQKILQLLLQLGSGVGFSRQSPQDVCRGVLCLVLGRLEVSGVQARVLEHIRPALFDREGLEGL